MGFNIWSQPSNQVMATTHEHADIELNYLFAGKITYIHGGDLQTVKPHQLCAFWAGIPHQAIKVAPNTEGIWITVPLEHMLRWARLRLFTDALLSGQLLIEPFSSNWINESDPMRFTTWVTEFSSGMPEISELILSELKNRLVRMAHSLAHQAADKSKMKHAESDAPFCRILEYLGKHYKEPLSLKVVANALHLHEKSVPRIFKTYCSMTVWEYISKLRVADAQRQLINTNLKTIEIANACGFQTSSAFYQAFRKYSGDLTPSQFRKSIPLGKNMIENGN